MMIKFSWLKCLIYFVIVLLGLEVLKTVISRIGFSAVYLFNTIIISLQSLALLGFLWYLLCIFFLRKRLRRKKLFLFFSLSLVCFVALMELLFTNWLHNPDKIPVGWRWAYKYYYDVYYFKIVQFEKELVALDNELLYTLKPGARQGFCSAEFKTSIHINNQGFRDDETSSFSPEIICLGDSFTMGWGVEESESFPALLEKKTGRKVLNAGTPSYGTAREVMLFERLDISHLKCIIIQYCSNDIEENFSFVDNNYKLGLTSASAYKFSMASYELSRRYFPAKNFLMIGQLWVKRQINRVYPFFTLSGQPYDEIFDEKKHAESFMKTLFYLLQKVKDVQIVVTNIDVRKYKHNRFINELRRWLHKEEYAGLLQNVKFVDCDEVLSDKDYFTLDYHINVSGHKKVAEKLIYTIKAR